MGSDYTAFAQCGELWGKLRQSKLPYDTSCVTYELVDSLILLIEGIQEVYEEQGLDLERDMDMQHRINGAVVAIKAAL